MRGELDSGGVSFTRVRGHEAEHPPCTLTSCHVCMLKLKCISQYTINIIKLCAPEVVNSQLCNMNHTTVRVCGAYVAGLFWVPFVRTWGTGVCPHG